METAAVDTTAMIDPSKPLKFDDLGLTLPAVPPTQVVSIRLPSALLNEPNAPCIHARLSRLATNLHE